MTDRKDRFAEYPDEINNRTQAPVVTYRRVPDRYAVRREKSDTSKSEDALFKMNEGDDVIEIFRGKPVEISSSGAVVPVYSPEPGGLLAVPTGQIFIRFKEGVSAEQRRPAIEDAGYEIAQSLDYAPNAAWLRELSGDTAKALAGIDALEKIADVENVEPQMLMRKVGR